MKRLSSAIIVFIVFMQCNPVFASYTFTYERTDDSSPVPLVYESGLAPEYNEINGVKYMWKSLKTGHPLQYDPIGYQVLTEAGLDDCIWTGQYYMARNSSADSIGYRATNKSPIKFFDKDFNLVREQSFEGYPQEIGYYNGTYYCRVYDNKGETYGSYTVTSTDTINWVRMSEENSLIPQELGKVLYKPKVIHSGGVMVDSIFSFTESDSYHLIHENSMAPLHGMRWGGWAYILSDKSIYFTNDNIYYVEINVPELTESNPSANIHILCAYEYGDDIVFDAVVDRKAGYRLRTPKQPIYDELARMKNAPYVVCDNKILGFTQPPVIEDDRTLVPMRFLFEQMGANVDWNNHTQTATVRENGKEIAFSIDSTEAKIGGNIKTMDVPARLINDKTMVPLRFLSEGLGYTVQWDEERHIASISKPEDVTAMRFGNEKTSDKFWF